MYIRSGLLKAPPKSCTKRLPISFQMLCCTVFTHLLYREKQSGRENSLFRHTAIWRPPFTHRPEAKRKKPCSGICQSGTICLTTAHGTGHATANTTRTTVTGRSRQLQSPKRADSIQRVCRQMSSSLFYNGICLLNRIQYKLHPYRCSIKDGVLSHNRSVILIQCNRTIILCPKSLIYNDFR